MPQPGEAWSVADALHAVVAAGPVDVLDVRGDRVIFADSRGAVGSFAVGIFAGLFDPPPS